MCNSLNKNLIMKYHKKIILLIALSIIFFSCKKDEDVDESCYDIKYEITGSSTTIDSIDFRLASSSYSNPDVSRYFSNLTVPYSETVNICKDDFDFNLRCYDSDTTIVLTLKIFRDGSLIKQKTGSLGNFIELAGGIND